MILTVTSYKGGVGKTTTAVHLAAYFSQKAATVLIDGDPNRSAVSWGSRGKFPFRTVDENQIAVYARKCEHLIIDTRGRPEMDHLESLAEGCDLIIVPCTPDQLSIEALLVMVQNLRKIPSAQYRVLLTMVPPRPSPRGKDAREALIDAGVLLFKGEIRRTLAFQDAAMQATTVDQVRSDVARVSWNDYERVAREVELLYPHAPTTKV